MACLGLVLHFENGEKRYPQPYGEGLAPTRRGRETGIGDPYGRVSGWVRDRLGRWRLYGVHDSSLSSLMRKTANVDDNESLRPDGSNLAAFLHYLQEMHDQSYNLIRRTVQRAAALTTRN
jgi:predicted ATPase